VATIRILAPETKTEKWKREDINVAGPGFEVYRLLNAAGELLYVGMTGNPFERWRDHSYNRCWWSEVAYICTMRVPTKLLAQDHELEAIKQDRPKYNRHAAVR
jgi:excinuclease UvrABC nuclease subunit